MDIGHPLGMYFCELWRRTTKNPNIRNSNSPRAGMRTDLILDEEEKKTRFRKALEKKQASLEAGNLEERGEEETKRVGGLVEVKQELSPPASSQSGAQVAPPGMESVVAMQAHYPPPNIPLSPRLQAPLPPGNRRHYLPRGRIVNPPVSPFQVPHSPRPYPSPRMTSPQSPQSPISPHATPHIMNPFSPSHPSQGSQQSRASPFSPSHSSQQSPQSIHQPFSPRLHLAPPSPPINTSFSSSTHPSSELTGVLSPSSTTALTTQFRRGLAAPASYTPQAASQPFYPTSPALSCNLEIKEEPAEDVKAWESLVAEKTGVAYYHNPLSPYEKPTTSKISYDRLHEAFGDVIRVKVEDRARANIHEMMERYVHKKLHQPRRFSSKCSNYGVEFDNKEFEMPNIATMSPVKKRKSVIVRAGGAAKNEAGKESNNDNEGGNNDLPDIDSSIEDMLASIGETEDILLTTGLYPILGYFNIIISYLFLNVEG